MIGEQRQSTPNESDEIIEVRRPTLQQVGAVLEEYLPLRETSRMRKEPLLKLQEWLTALLDRGIADQWRNAEYCTLRMKLERTLATDAADIPTPQSKVEKRVGKQLDTLLRRLRAAEMMKRIVRSYGVTGAAIKTGISTAFVYMILKLRRSITDRDMAERIAEQTQGDPETITVPVRGAYRRNRKLRREHDAFLDRSDITEIVNGLKQLNRRQVAIVRRLVRDLADSNKGQV
jgi:hypothetical protein